MVLLGLIRGKHYLVNKQIYTPNERHTKKVFIRGFLCVRI